MKRSVCYISIFVCALLTLAGCVKSEYVDNTLNRSDSVVLTIKTTSGDVSRSEDTSVEERIDWVDVFVFNADADLTVFHKERIDVSRSPIYKSGEVSLSMKREEFVENATYYLYLVANANDELAASNIATWSDLQPLIQEDNNLHLSAFLDGNDKAAFADAPAHFLMCGSCSVNGVSGTATAPGGMMPCVINDPDVKELVLSGVLYRAAAKYIINIKPGNSVSFKQELDGESPQYYVNQLPVSTRLLPQAAHDYYQPVKQNTDVVGLNDHTLVWNSDNTLTIVGYGYAHDWSDLEYTKQTSMIFNIPMLWDKDANAGNGHEEHCAANWYKVPLSKNKCFERNTCYVINITINAEGADEKEYAIELKDIEYITQPWVERDVTIGGYEAAFLTLNTDLVKIYNTNIDTDQLTFSSSSPIRSIRLKDVFAHDETRDEFRSIGSEFTTDGGRDSVVVADAVYAYYVDKFGQKVQLGTDPNFDIKDVDHPEWSKDDILAKELNLYMKEGVDKQHIRAEVWEGQERALNGNINIFSPINAVAGDEDLDWNSHFNTIRYLEFEVENEQGITAIFRVMQYPLVVITNEEGYFSYRSDQKFSDDQAEASHYHNYMGYKSFHLTGLMWGYEFDWTNVPAIEEEDWFVGDSAKDYSTVIDNPNAVTTKAFCEVLHYGNLGAPHSFVDNRGVTFSTYYGGLYKSTTFPAEPFLRHRYYQYPGGQTTGIYKKNGYRFNSKNYDYPRGDIQGLAIGPSYERDGRIYRKQFVWNVQPIFYNLYVSKVYDKNENGKLKGQADLNSMTYSVSMEPGIMDGTWVSWEKQGYTNHRMYKVTTTTPQSGYSVGYPALDESKLIKNIPGNAIMVSPVLQVASQLGETRYQSIITLAAQNNYKVPMVGEFYKLAEEHCREYVETTFIDKDGDHAWDEDEEVIHYDDWRLPTKAEIDRMIELQESSRAMDKLLVGQYYFCITGAGYDADVNVKENWVSTEVPNYSSSMTGYYIRCVRDVNSKK